MKKNLLLSTICFLMLTVGMVYAVTFAGSRNHFIQNPPEEAEKFYDKMITCTPFTLSYEENRLPVVETIFGKDKNGLCHYQVKTYAQAELKIKDCRLPKYFYVAYGSVTKQVLEEAEQRRHEMDESPDQGPNPGHPADPGMPPVNMENDDLSQVNTDPIVQYGELIRMLKTNQYCKDI